MFDWFRGLFQGREESPIERDRRIAQEQRQSIELRKLRIDLGQDQSAGCFEILALGQSQAIDRALLVDHERKAIALLDGDLYFPQREGQEPDPIGALRQSFQAALEAQPGLEGQQRARALEAAVRTANLELYAQTGGNGQNFNRGGDTLSLMAVAFGQHSIDALQLGAGELYVLAEGQAEKPRATFEPPTQLYYARINPAPGSPIRRPPPAQLSLDRSLGREETPRVTRQHLAVHPGDFLLLTSLSFTWLDRNDIWRIHPRHKQLRDSLTGLFEGSEEELGSWQGFVYRANEEGQFPACLLLLRYQP